MWRHTPHDHATSNVLAWSQHAANVGSTADDEATTESDEPPDSNLATQNPLRQFMRTSLPIKANERHASLLTLALHRADEGDTPACAPSSTLRNTRAARRPSISSDISVASSADLTSDTGMSTPARTSSPSPRLLNVGFVLPTDKYCGVPVQIAGSLPRRDLVVPSVCKPDLVPNPAVLAVAKVPDLPHTEKKRCISFACAAKPKNDAGPAPAPGRAAVPALAASAMALAPAESKRPCIKFACPPQPARPNTHQTPPHREQLTVPRIEDSGSVSTVISTPTTVRKARRTSSMTPRRSLLSPARLPRKKKYITASSDELQAEELVFHAFAGEHPAQDEWIREEKAASKGKLLLDDLLKKENDIRRIAKEAEEEAAEEETEDEDDGDDNVDEEEEEETNAEEDEVEENVDDDQSGYGSEEDFEDFSDGYNTDEDLALLDSDDEQDDDLCLWTLTASQSYMAKFSVVTPVFRRSSLGAMSDSSDCSRRVNVVRTKRARRQSAVARPVTPDLPDSTDFVCGTMDEDRPLEEAYITRLAARKLQKLRAIPQDIDPSFPASDHEEDEDEDVLDSHDSGEPLWLHGELEELHDERAGRRKRKGEASPLRHRSPPPPPKRYHSPPPKARGRSPRRLYDHASPKRIKSPAPVAHPEPLAELGSETEHDHALAFTSLASRPGLTHTKSLPRASYFPAHIKSGKRAKAGKSTTHVRGAIDIVKGLEEKRQRRKEKFHRQYCERARKGQVPEKKKARIGEGAERMRELGLLSAGKRNYVISV